MKNPFKGLSQIQIDKLYRLLSVNIYNFKKDDEILLTIKNDNIIAIILEGSAQIVNIDYNGNEILVEHLIKDSVLELICLL